MAVKLLSDDPTDTVVIKDTDLLPADGDPTTTYTLRHLTLDMHREIVRGCTKKVRNPKTHQREDEIDWDAVNDKVFDHVLVAWTGVTNGTASPAPCDWEHKKRLDGVRRLGILEKAGMNEIQAAAERRQESFRPPAT